MRAAEIIKLATEQAVQLALSRPGDLFTKGTPAAIDRWPARFGNARSRLLVGCNLISDAAGFW